MYVCKCVYVHACVYMCVHACVCKCVYVYACVYTCVCMCDVLWKSEQSVRCCSGDGVPCHCESPRFEELDFLSLKGLQVLLTSEPSLQPQFMSILAFPDEKRLDQVGSKHIMGTEGDRGPLIKVSFGKHHC